MATRLSELDQEISRLRRYAPQSKTLQGLLYLRDLIMIRTHRVHPVYDVLDLVLFQSLSESC